MPISNGDSGYSPMEVMEAIIDLSLIDAAAAEAQGEPMTATLHPTCTERA